MQRDQEAVTMTAPIVEPSTLLTPEEVSERYRGRINTRTLANWRTQGEGPRYTKIGGRVFYPLSELIAWEARRTLGAKS